MPDKIPTSSAVYGSVWISQADFDRRFASGGEGKPYAITPNDSTDLPEPVSILYIGSTGSVRVLTDNGDIILNGLDPGVFHRIPFLIRRVYATGTTATGIVGVR